MTVLLRAQGHGLLACNKSIRISLIQNASNGVEVPSDELTSLVENLPCLDLLEGFASEGLTLIGSNIITFSMKSHGERC